MTSIPAAANVELIHRLQPRVVLLPGLPHDGIDEVAAAADSVGALLFVDPQSTPITIETPQTVHLLSLVDIFAPNEREARAMTGHDDLDDAIRVLATMTGLVVVKRGADGATVADQSGVLHVQATPVQPVETTGAGDSFNAGFVMALLDGDSIEECMQAGNAAGMLSTLAQSGEGVPTRDMLVRARAHNRQQS